MIYEEDKNRLEREIEVLKIIRHPNLIHLYSVLKKDDTIYLIMKYIKGIELFDYIVNKTKLTEFRENAILEYESHLIDKYISKYALLIAIIVLYC